MTPEQIAQMLQEKERINFLAARLGTYIPQTIVAAFWALPILEALVEKVLELEKKLEENK